MSTRETRRRRELLERLSEAGRDFSDTAVMFHTALAEKVGLNASEWKMLGLLQRHGPLTAGGLAALSGLAPASVTGIIDRLERGAWVRRARDARDGRRVRVSLDQRVLERNFGELFGGLARRLEKLYARYPDDDLALLLELMTEIARRQKEATVELRERRGAQSRAGRRSGRKAARRR